MIDSDMHLVQRPLYRSGKNGWFFHYMEAVQHSPEVLDWDPAAILAILSFCYTSGDRTLLAQIRRKPWLSEIDTHGEVALKNIPPHGLLGREPLKMAQEMEQLLLTEAKTVCKGRDEIYLLLSGGLDSRIVAGILSRLYQERYLKNKPIGITWGMENTRDVVYAREVARLLDFEWQAIPNNQEVLLHNLEMAPEIIAALVPPNHLHNVNWFRNVSSKALVLAGSYGDSIGRGEYSGKHLAELGELVPFNAYGLLREEVAAPAISDIWQDFDGLYKRSPAGTPNYVLREHAMQAIYMRNMFGQIMSSINRYCDYYQVFTAPEVYGYMWSIHPVCRNNEMYAELLERLNPELARLPWARTNKALRGRTVGKRENLRDSHHNYSKWISKDIYHKYADYVCPSWFEATGLFDPSAIAKLSDIVRQGKEKYYKTYEIWAWLATFRKFAEMVEKSGRKIKTYEVSSISPKMHMDAVRTNNRSFLRRMVSRNVILSKYYFLLRRVILKKQLIKQYPPQING